MRTAKVSDLIDITSSLYPFYLAEEWDTTGLQLGDPAGSAEKIMVALDPSPKVIESAITMSCTLLLTHHPLFFKPLKTITAATPLGKLAILAIKNNLSVLSIHTNYDSASGGLNDLLAAALGVKNCDLLSPNRFESLSKISVFVPDGYQEEVRSALSSFSPKFGNYSECSFSVKGEGVFLPGPDSAPFIGKHGKLERVSEYKIEMLIDKYHINSAIKAMLSVHPYQEPAFDVYPLQNQKSAHGLGRIGVLDRPATLSSIAANVEETLGIPVRYSGDADKLIRKVALCSGSGASLIKTAAAKGADLYITGDVKHHDVLDAEAAALPIIDAGHFGTEHIMVKDVASKLRRMLSDKNLTAEVVEAQEKDIWSYPVRTNC